MVRHVALQVHLGGVLHPHEVGVEDSEVGGPPLWESQPGFQGFSGQAIQNVKMSLVNVVDCKVELEGRKDVAGVDCHLVLASDEGRVQVGQLLLQLGLQEVEVVGRSVQVGDGGAQELVGVVFHGLQEDFL